MSEVPCCICGDEGDNQSHIICAPCYHHAHRAPVEIEDEMVERALAAHQKATAPFVYENAAAMRAALAAALNQKATS